jgi:regulator of protease activity HflC (stomatin/prohibitin superfamily)
MNYASQIFEFIQKILVWWVTIMPWEEAVHVRFGKKVRILTGGIYFRLPFVDKVFIQTNRLRVAQGPPQTVTTSDGKALTLVACLGYSIVDIRRVYMELFNAETTLCNILQGVIADEVCRRTLAECHPSELEKAINNAMAQTEEKYGLKFAYTKITGFALVKTFRLIQDSSHWVPDNLNTNKPQ